MKNSNARRRFNVCAFRVHQGVKKYRTFTMPFDHLTTTMMGEGWRFVSAQMV
jgi:hypothetical protein